MDWLDEKFYRIRVWLHNLSLRKALSVYILLCIAIVISLYAITIAATDRWDRVIWSRYDNQDYTGIEANMVYTQDDSKLGRTDRIMVEAIDAIQSWSIVIYSIGGIIGVSYSFFKNKMKEPLMILKSAASKIGNNNLDIEMHYDCKDEMGDLCHSFDLMRNQLISNNQKMWDMMEEQKRLNAAFAHDLRTPMTVLRGYTDFLLQYVPEGKVNEEKLCSTLTLMSKQLIRLENYSNTMKEINSLEEVPVHQQQKDMNYLYNRLNETIHALNGRNGIEIELHPADNSSEMIYIDENLFLEVFDNLMSNALRFAKTKVEVTAALSENKDKVILSVADDGEGFSSKGLIMAAKPYYTNASEDKEKHFGIGLYICRLLCEKHRGSLRIANRMQPGALLTAEFCVRKF